MATITKRALGVHARVTPNKQKSNDIEDPVHPCAGVDDIGCLAFSPDASVRYEDVKILNLHFHANSEHTLTGKGPTQLFITSYSCSKLL